MSYRASAHPLTHPCACLPAGSPFAYPPTGPPFACPPNVVPALRPRSAAPAPAHTGSNGASARLPVPPCTAQCGSPLRTPRPYARLREPVQLVLEVMLAGLHAHVAVRVLRHADHAARPSGLRPRVLQRAGAPRVAPRAARHECACRARVRMGQRAAARGGGGGGGACGGRHAARMTAAMRATSASSRRPSLSSSTSGADAEGAAGRYTCGRGRARLAARPGAPAAPDMPARWRPTVIWFACSARAPDEYWLPGVWTPGSEADSGGQLVSSSLQTIAAAQEGGRACALRPPARPPRGSMRSTRTPPPSATWPAGRHASPQRPRRFKQTRHHASTSAMPGAHAPTPARRNKALVFQKAPCATAPAAPQGCLPLVP